MAPRCIWTDTDDIILVEELVRLKIAGKQAESGWKRDSWTSVAAVLKEKGVNKGAEKIWSKCQDHFGNMKKEFKDVLELSRKSGFGFEDTTKMVIASETMWANELGKNPKYAYWKTHPYPLYHSMLFLVEGIMATGERAFHPGQPAAVSHDDSPAVDSSSQGAQGGDDTSGDSHLPGGDDDTSNNSHLPGGGEENAENGDKATENDDEVSATVNSSPPPATQSRRRQGADSDPPEAVARVSKSARRSGGRNFVRNAKATRDVADAMRSLASSMAADPSTLRCRGKAIALLEDDGEYSEDEEIKILMLFARDKAVADSYTSIRKKSQRIKYIRAELYHEDNI